MFAASVRHDLHSGWDHGRMNNAAYGAAVHSNADLCLSQSTLLDHVELLNLGILIFNE